MIASPTENAPAKINLTLRIVGQRADGYHELESLVAFADAADVLALQPGEPTVLTVEGPFAAACGSLADNLVLKAATALRDRVPKIRAGHFRLLKNLPVAGGVGGGSADAAAALRLLARVNNFSLGDARLAASALAAGADVPVCLEARSRIMCGVGEKLSARIAVPAVPALLVNPGVPLSTRDVFAAFSAASPAQKPLGPVPEEREAFLAFLAGHGNDLTQAAIACAPAVAEVLRALEAMTGARLARMSGSGPTCFALFNTAGEAVEARRTLQAAHKDWWLHAGTIGPGEP